MYNCKNIRIPFLLNVVYNNKLIIIKNTNDKQIKIKSLASYDIRCFSVMIW